MAADELVGGLIRNHLPLANDHEVIRGLGHLGQEVGGNQNGAPFCSQRAHELAHPADTFRI